jgi:lysophospholipase L1-like esterase
LSDPVDLIFAPGTDVLVSIDVPEQIEIRAATGSLMAVAPTGQSLQEKLEGANQMLSRPLVTGVMVETRPVPAVIVAMGDSITDGNRPSLGALHAWPEQLARRLAARRTGGHYAVVNAGMGGNRLLAPGAGLSGLARLDRDVLRIEGLSHLILLEGTNDIGASGKALMGDNPPISASDLIMGYRQVIARAHARGVKVILGTLTPVVGSITHVSPEKEPLRQSVNQWIRTSGEPDGVIDFDKIVRNPAAPETFLQQYDSGDHLHPSEAGHKAMGDGIDLSMFP